EKSFQKDANLLGMTEVFVEDLKQNIKILIASNKSSIFSLEFATGEEVWTLSFKENILFTVKREEEIVVVHGKKPQKVEKYSTIDGELIWEHTVIDRLNLYESNPSSVERLTDVVFYDVKENDNILRLDVCVLTGGNVVTRLDGFTGKLIYQWRADTGDVYYHALVVSHTYIFVLGTSITSAGKIEAAVVGIDSDGDRSYTDFFPLSPKFNNFDTFVRSLTTLGVNEDRFILYKINTSDNSKDLIIRSFERHSYHSLKSLTNIALNENCKEIEIFNFHSENFHMHEFVVECFLTQGKKDWLIQLEVSEKNVVVGDAIELKKNVNPNEPWVEEQFAFKDYSEEPYAATRIYLQSKTVLVLEMIDLETGNEIYNIEVDLKPCKFSNGEEIYNSFISTTMENDIINWNLMLITNSNRWISLQSNETTVNYVKKKGFKNKGILQPPMRDEL
ncbi:hypothetical protein HDU92_003443, partial [Lobulomyces angularis]